jgi:hypothetical protein
MSSRNVPLSEQTTEPNPQANRRATVRYHCALATPGGVFLLEKQELQRAWVLDLSLCGAGLLLNRALPVGQLVMLRMKGAGGEHTYELPARVAHATRETGGDWVVGCELLTRLTPDELDALLQ